MDLYSA